MEFSDYKEPMTFFAPGKCPLCSSELIVMDMETSIMSVSPSGNPIDERTMVRCEAICTNCKHKVPMMRDGLRYIPDTEYNRLLAKYRNSEKRKEVEVEMEKLKPTEDNPFCINIKKQE